MPNWVNQISNVKSFNVPIPPYTILGIIPKKREKNKQMESQKKEGAFGDK